MGAHSCYRFHRGTRAPNSPVEFAGNQDNRFENVAGVMAPKRGNGAKGRLLPGQQRLAWTPALADFPVQRQVSVRKAASGATPKVGYRAPAPGPNVRRSRDLAPQ